MTGAHEEPGLSEPTDRAAKMRAVDREDLKGISGDAADPAGNIARLAIPIGGFRIAVVDQAGLALRKIAKRAEVDPCVIA